MTRLVVALGRLLLLLVLVMMTTQIVDAETTTECSLEDETTAQCTETTTTTTMTTSTTETTTLKEGASAATNIVCADKVEECPYWSALGECEKNPNFMLENCAKSCQACAQKTTTTQPLSDNEEQRQGFLDEIKRLHSNEQHGAFPLVPNGFEETILGLVREMIRYVDQTHANPKTSDKMRVALSKCQNKNDKCLWWAAMGECNHNPDFMAVDCPLVCHYCNALIPMELLFNMKSCPLNPHNNNTLPLSNAWKPGTLHETFVNITTLPFYQQYKPIVLSQPSHDDDDDDDDDDDEGSTPINRSNREEKDEEEKEYGETGDPWVVLLKNFLSEEEAVRLIELGHQEGFKRSPDITAVSHDGTFQSIFQEGRTSTQAWCQRDACYKDPTSRTVMDRIANLTNIPEVNAEYLQLLRYDVGQFYVPHHDYIFHQEHVEQGPRLITVYLYLSDVQEGGGTRFPQLNLTVIPKRGQALVWPSVLNDNPNLYDPRTQHEALPVEKGLKYGANAWIHQRDFKGPNERGCR